MNEEKIKKGVSLKNYTTFKIGGKADYFLKAGTAEDIKEGIKWAQNKNVPFFILGGGSNLLVSDEGLRGLVIRITNYELRITNKNKGSVTVVCGAGVELAELKEFCLEHGLSGIEWAAGIPKATLGGAVYMNAGAFGSCMADIVKNVEALDAEDMALKTYNATQCGFGNKESIFKQNKNLIILSAFLRFAKKPKQKIQARINKVLCYRKKYHPLGFPSSGCAFKNPTIKNQDSKLLRVRSVLSRFEKQGIIPAGWLIQECGLQGKTIGGAEISNKHANFIINKGRAKASDVRQLIGLIKEKVGERFGIGLEEEVEVLNQESRPR